VCRIGSRCPLSWNGWPDYAENASPLPSLLLAGLRRNRGGLITVEDDKALFRRVHALKSYHQIAGQKEFSTLFRAATVASLPTGRPFCSGCGLSVLRCERLKSDWDRTYPMAARPGHWWQL
jgi:hypothetical protein